MSPNSMRQGSVMATK